MAQNFSRKIMELNLTKEIQLDENNYATVYTDYPEKYTHERFVCECGSREFEVFSRDSVIWYVDAKCIKCGKLFEIASE